MSPNDVEEAVLAMEEVRIVIRVHPRAQLRDWNYTRKAAGTASVTEWLEQRIKPIVGDHPVVVIDGSGRNTRGQTRMATLRASYCER